MSNTGIKFTAERSEARLPWRVVATVGGVRTTVAHFRTRSAAQAKADELTNR